MDIDVEKAAKVTAKSALSIAAVGLTLGKYGLTATHSFLSGANNLANEFSGYNGKNFVADNINKFATKAIDKTGKFISNLKNKLSR